MLRQILIAIIAVVAAAAPATAQRSFEIPGLGTIYFGGGKQRQQIDPQRVDQRFKVLDRKRNYNDESRVVFDVGRGQGRFSQLRLRAVGKVVRITGMEVVFGNGKSQKIDIYQAIYPGEVSPPLDLTGDARGIRRVVVTKRRTWQRDRGEIELLGLPDETAGYKLIGEERHRDRDRDVVFDARGGRYDKIRLRALGAPVRISTIEVTYGNRRTQTIRYYKTLYSGDLTAPIDLDGDSRRIKEVVVNKRRSWNNDDRGTLQLYGEPGKAPPAPRYTVLGTERVGRGDRDIVFDNIDQRNRWNEIRLKAVDRPVRIDDLVIVFGNGKRQRVDIDERLAPGDVTRVIPLDGRNARHIDRIRVDVDRRRRGRRSGRLQVLGVGRPVAAAPARPRRAAQQQIPPGWVLFGSETVGRRAERQVLPIGREAGVFDRITFRALRNDIHIRDVTVVYGNGKRDSRNIDLLVPAGYGTPPIDLKNRSGKGRYIQEIIVTYRSEGRRWRDTALLQVYGEYADDWLRAGERRAGRGDNWVLLGARKAAKFSKDTDAIAVGRRFGRFRAVKIRVVKKKVKLYGMRIYYENGTNEAVPIYGTFRSGQSSQPFDLKGRKRFIKQINLKYRTKFSLGGDGIVEVWGLR